jgi:hypothetical protein
LSVSPTGTVVVPVASTTTYTLTVTNSINVSTTQQLTINVSTIPNPVINSFNRSFNNVIPYTNVTLTSFFTGGTGIITPGPYTVTNGQTITVAPAVTTTYTLTVTNANNVSVSQDRTIDVVQITPTLTITPNSVLRGGSFQVQYLVPIAVTAASVTVVMIDQATGQVFVNPADFTVVSSSDDTTSVAVPFGGRLVTTVYDLTVGAQSAFVSRYGNNFVRLDISIQGPGISLTQELYIEGDY